MSNNIFNLTKKQRLDMQFKGLSPLNPEHVEQYINSNGQVKSSYQESVERAKTMIGEEAFAKTSLGNKYSWEGGNSSIGSGGGNPNVDIREQLKNDMDGYVGSGRSNLMESLDDFDSRQTQPKKQQQVNAQQIFDLGYNNTIAYLNAFIRNLKKPSQASRLEIFKTLQSSLKDGQTYKTNPNAAKAYESGSIKAEKEMFEKLRK